MRHPFADFSTTHLYTPQNALALAHAAQLSYEGELPACITGFSWGFQPRFFEVEDTQVLLLDHGDYLVIAPRGTEFTRENKRAKRGKLRRLLAFIVRLVFFFRFGVDLERYDLSDVITDLDFRKRPAPLGGHAHKGFLKAFGEAWAGGVGAYLDKVRRERGLIPVFLCGHSLGAGIATLIAAAMCEQGWRPRGVYLYGSPRVGDWRFHRCLNTLLEHRIHRHRLTCDAVTKIPLKIMNFCHVGRHIYISSEGIVMVNPEPSVVFWDSFLARVRDIGVPGTAGTKHHAMARYIEALEGAL